uniref:DNA replication ATP-dependent helicase/nuclease n=1 Tax=Denticeps clupeoides TaxID=299321 RepID=A0AAY4E547_9TELE
MIKWSQTLQKLNPNSLFLYLFLKCYICLARKTKRIPDHVMLATGIHNRYWVLDVQEKVGPKGYLEKLLILTSSKTSEPTEKCILQDDWVSTPVSVGDVVHLEGKCVAGTWVMNRDFGFLVLLPDLLISGTSIASSIRCMRRAVLGEMFKVGSKHMLNELNNNLTIKSVNNISLIGLLFSDRLWWNIFDSVCTVTVNDFVDIEENIWSPRFGLKGKIDVTAGVRIHRRDRSHVDKVVPLELKTGKESNSIEHRSQVILYTLMGLERRCDAETGFLLYLKTGNLHPVVGNHMDRRELLKLRNLLAHHLGNNLEKVEGGTTRLAPLPAVIFDSQACKFCPQMRNCALYNNSSAEPQPPFLEQESQHLNQLHLQYFSRWLLLCTLEARTMENKGSRRNIWLQSAQDREKSGSCMANMKRTGEVAALADDVFLHHFKRQGGIQALTGLIVGDRVVVSGQDVRLIGVAAGYVTEMTSDAVTCSLDRDLSKYPASVVFRLDQDEGAGGLSTHVGNLSKLMENSPTSQRLRELIVEFRAPQFIDSLSSVLPRNAKDTVANILKGLNKPQKQAMKKVLLSKDYTLIVGMPGTGKTTTICTLVPAIETVEKGGISNHTEAVLVHAVVSLLVKAGCKAVDIGVIAPYRQQLKAISGLLEAPAYRSVEVNTVDKYQGRDKSVIIVSFVRSNMEANLGELLKDWRRLNVAITRAKHKLLMIGSSTALRLYSPLLKLLTHLEQENMISFLFSACAINVISCWFLSFTKKNHIFQLPPAAHEVLKIMYWCFTSLLFDTSKTIQGHNFTDWNKC